MQRKDYYLGLDIGTESIGYAVTDQNYKLLRFHGKDMWGSRLFDEAKPAVDRRTQRTTRRRLERRKWRIRILQQLFAEEIAKVDMGFFQRLKDSVLLAEDKAQYQSDTLFHDADYTDQMYHQEFPTIYHLRKALIENKKEYDVRLLYLAIHHIMKHRGHFLFTGGVENVTSFATTYEKFQMCLKDEFERTLICDDVDAFAEVLKDKSKTKTDKNKKIIELLHCEKSDKQLKAIIGVLCGSKVKLSEIFQDESLTEYEKNSFSFEQSAYDDLRPNLEEVLDERVGILDVLKGVYDWAILADILQGGEYENHAYLSFAKVGIYEKHQKDLVELKALLQKYDEVTYRNFFKRSGTDNYCAYIGGFLKDGKRESIKRCKKEDFYKVIKKMLTKLEKMVVEENDLVRIQRIVTELDQDSFLPLQVSKDNGVIPSQVHGMELKAILQHAKSYMSFLNEVDTSGISVAEKIVKLFEFKIPYYVGPLNTNCGNNSWMERKEAGAILPWNFEQKVDVDKSAEKFIRRMTNKCTYLVGEDVLPKNSLLYTEFTVWNELNNVKVNGDKLSVALKQKFFETYFCTKKRVTGKMLLNFLKSEGLEVQAEDLSGFDKNFASSLTSYLDFRKIFEDKMSMYSTREMVENLILWITLYGEDTKMLKRVIRKEYDREQITQEQIKKVLRLKYQGWGRLSKAFLTEIEGTHKEVGEALTIMQGLRITNDNLMQLLSDEYIFTEMIQDANQKHLGQIASITYDNVVRDLVASPAIKRSIWQVILIAEEIKKIMGCEPKKIFIEMARGGESKPERKESRKNRFIELYKNIKSEERDWKKELEDRPESDFRSIKLYLYYTQMGKCMYSGEAISLAKLADATIYDRDHIYPQSKTKDDSIDNLVLVKRTINATKNNDVLSSEIQQKMIPMWRGLLEQKLISKEKYNRLTRKTPLTTEELAGFINRQLVETRQSSKLVAELFKQLYEDSRVVYVKAGRVSEFRRDIIKAIKVRSMNDHHHAKDAYLNIVVGNVYDEKFTNNPLQWLKKNTNANYSLNRMYDFDLAKNGSCIWKRGEDGTKKTILATMKKNSVLYTRQAICNKGELFNQQLVKKTDNPSIPMKKGMDVTKYGGYKSINPAYFVLVESKGKKGELQRTIEAMPIYLVKQCEQSQEVYLEYCRTTRGLKEPRVVLPRIKKNALLVINGFPMHLRGTNEKDVLLQNAVQLCLDEESTTYLKKVEKYVQRNLSRTDKSSYLSIGKMDGITKEQNIELYQVLLDKQKNAIYNKRPASQVKLLEDKKDIFISLILEEQCIVLNEILHLCQCKSVTANFKLLNAGANVGLPKVNKNTALKTSAILINQSVTGLFEQKIDLRTV